MQLRLCLGDCLDMLASLDVEYDAVLCDPPYGVEFSQAKNQEGKCWDTFDWRIGGGFSKGGSDRFKGSPPLPSFANFTSENRVCRKCKGTERGQDRKGFHRCRCADPDFPPRAFVSSDYGRRIQEGHVMWLQEACRVLRPGGLLAAFGATRMFHRLAGAMEEAGLVDIRLESWSYGNGFPKSLSVGKSIDKQWGRIQVPPESIPMREVASSIPLLKRELKRLFDASGKSRKQIDDECGFRACKYLSAPEPGKRPDPWFYVLPSQEKWRIIQRVLGVDDETVIGRPQEAQSQQHAISLRLSDIFQAAEREVVGYRTAVPGVAFSSEGPSEIPITVPATPEAALWESWGTAQKPAWEPVVVGRKPVR